MTEAEVIREFKVEDEYPLGAEDAGTYKTETFNQWVYDPVADVGMNIWFASGEGGGGQPFPNFISTIIVFLGGETWVARGDGRGNYENGIAAGNAFLTRIEPFKRWKIDFLGLLQRSQGAQGASGFDNAEDPRLSRMDLTVEIVTPPIEQGSQGDRGEVASSGTTPRTAVRYEQLCRIAGTLQIGERRIEVNAYGMRSHRRNSASIYASGAVGHSWATALFPSGQGFHLLSYQAGPEAAVNFLYGHYFDGTRYHEVEVTRFPFYSGVMAPERTSLEMQLNGRTIAVTLDTVAPLASSIPPQGVRLTRSPGRFTMDGEVGGGVLERSLMPEFAAGGDYQA